MIAIQDQYQLVEKLMGEGAFKLRKIQERKAPFL